MPNGVGGVSLKKYPPFHEFPIHSDLYNNNKKVKNDSNI